MGKLFCRCLLGLREEKRQDSVCVTHGFDSQRELPASDAASSKTKVPGEMAQAQEAPLQPCSRQQPDSFQPPSQPPNPSKRSIPHPSKIK